MKLCLSINIYSLHVTWCMCVLVFCVMYSPSVLILSSLGHVPFSAGLF